MKKRSTLLWIIFILIISAAQAQNLQWEELGPKSTGGRTRTILVDKRDPTRATVYAGMVSGGLWKSTDRGGTWHVLLSVYSSPAVTCIAQDMNGRIYFGTGEGLSEPSGSSRNSGSVGNGLHFLYGNDLDSVIPSTMPPYLSDGVAWCMINRIAINPTNPLDIYVATSGGSNTGNGLQHTLDGGQTWTLIGSPAAPIQNLSAGYNWAADVKFNSTGTHIYASVGIGAGSFPGCHLIVSQDGGSTFSYVIDSTFTTNMWRIEIATSPSEPNITYISVAGSAGLFKGVWESPDGGSSWVEVGPPTGVLATVFGADGQGWYDNTLAVYPNNYDRLFLGGVQLYTYSSLTGWTLASLYNGNISDPTWVQPDMQTLVFNDLDSNEMYIGCDGGIFKTTNASSSFPNPTYAVSNNGYNTVQNYSVASDLNGNVLGGTQNAGTNLVDINHGSQQVYARDGVYTEISRFDSSVFIGGYIGGQEKRSYDRGNNWNYMFDAAIDPRAQGDPSICGQALGNNAPFITAFWLTETKTATNSISRVPFVANVAHNAGDVVTLTSHIGQPFQETLTAPLPAGDTVYFTDRLQSRLYFATGCGLWMTQDILDFTIAPRWFRLTTSVDDVKSLAATSTGDTIYIGRNSIIERFTGLNSVVGFDTALTGHNDILLATGARFDDTTLQITAAGRYIEGMDVDVNNPNHVLCAVGGFSLPGTPHVYVSYNSGNSWTALGATGSSPLPDMPVYQCVIDAYDSAHYIIGSELGFWDSRDGGATWTEQNGGIIVREPVYRLRQQTYLSDQCYALYAGTHGRGMWRCTTLTAGQGCTVIPLGISETATTQTANNMLLYPNPMDGSGKVKLELTESSDVTILVMDMPGRMLAETSYSHLNAGENLLDLNASSLSNGSYLVVARLANGQTYTRTLVVAR